MIQTEEIVGRDSQDQILAASTILARHLPNVRRAGEVSLSDHGVRCLPLGVR